MDYELGGHVSHGHSFTFLLTSFVSAHYFTVPWISSRFASSSKFMDVSSKLGGWLPYDFASLHAFGTCPGPIIGKDNFIDSNNDNVGHVNAKVNVNVHIMIMVMLMAMNNTV